MGGNGGRWGKMGEIGESVGGWLHKHVVYDCLCFVLLCVQLSTVYIHIHIFILPLLRDCHMPLY